MSGKPKPARRQPGTSYFNYPNNYKGEGEDHINVSIQSTTRIGKLLDPAYLKVINYQYAGKFSSVMNLWYWVRSKDLNDEIRRMQGHDLKTYAEKNNLFNNYVPNFKAIILKATWIKVQSYPGVVAEIKQLPDDFPLLSYHIVKASGLRICSNYAMMAITIAGEVIKAIKEDREPDYSQFIDSPKLTRFDYLEGVLSKVLPPEKLDELKPQQAA